MTDKLTYFDLSIKGIFDAYCNHYNISEKNNTITLPNEIGSIKLQNLLLPGDMGVIFGEFDFIVDSLIVHEAEMEQKYALIISMLDSESQLLIWSKEAMTTSKKLQPVAFLLNSIFEFTQFRKAGTKGKSILIFIPKYMLESFGKEKTKEDLLGKFYALQTQGLSLLKLSDKETKIANNFFEQWKNHKNIIGMAKSVFQLLEWYFRSLNDFIMDDTKFHKLTEKQAMDLQALQNYIKNNLHLPKPDIETFQKTVNTPITKLKKLFLSMYNKSLYDYITSEKMNAAKDLLLNTEKNISEIAYEFGFANPSNFSTAFKKQFEFLPNEYRISHKNKLNE
jgi:AraC-like DNA-binding protein